MTKNQLISCHVSHRRGKNNSSDKTEVKKVARNKASPKGKQKLNKMKYEIANDIGVDLKEGYNGDMTSRNAGRIGGNMVRKMIAYAEENMPDDY
jgi:hypothetical protein